MSKELDKLQKENDSLKQELRLIQLEHEKEKNAIREECLKTVNKVLDMFEPEDGGAE